MIRAVCMFSGGKGSWAAARLWIDEHGPEGVVLLFTDTNGEDADLHRFLAEAAADLAVPLVTLDNDGRTIWDVFRKERMIANTRVSLCSRALKQEPARRWIDENAPGAIIVMGIAWTEEHRAGPVRRNWAPHHVAFPLIDYPAADVDGMLAQAGIAEPRLYSQGFAHNNCAGACVRAGQGQWAHLLRVNPARYAEEEAQEEAFRAETGKDVAILRDRRGGTTKPLTLRALRTRVEGAPETVDMDDIGGCGCMAEVSS